MSNQNETIKYNININNSKDFFNKKDFFPQELRSYIELLNKLFKRQNEILASGPNDKSVHKRESVQLPDISEYKEMQKTILNLPKDGIKKKKVDTVRYLTQERRNHGAPVGAEKNYIVAMAVGKKNKKPGTKKKAKKHRGNDDDESVQGDEGTKKSKKGKKTKGAKSGKKKDERETPKKSLKPVMTYRLSDLSNLKNGISVVPAETYTRKIISFRAEPAKPEISCFRLLPNEEVYYYSPNLIAALFNPEGTGYILYPNRDIAIEITRGRIGKKVVVYTESKTDKLGNYVASVPVAIFDDLGNGVVFDKYGKIRLNYDQGEGALYDTPSKVPFYWKWHKSQFLIQRRQELRYVDEDEPDNAVEDEEEAVESQEKTPEDKKKTKKKKKIKTAKGKSKKDTKSVSETDVDDEAVSGKKTGTKRKKKTPKQNKKKTAKKGHRDADDSPKEGKKSKRKGRATGHTSKKGQATGRASKKGRASGRTSKKGGRTSGRTSKRGGRASIRASKKLSTLTAKIRFGKLKAFMDMTKEKKRILPPVSKPPKVLVPITEIKPLALKITEHVSLRIMNQAHVHIDFAYLPFHITLYLGMKIYPEILERIDKITLDANDKRRVPCYFECLHKRTHSLIELYSKRNLMIEKGKKDRFKKRINNAYTMGTFIHLRRKKLISRE
ncbi:uncharacterized protein isoform X3 [Rhodnius prolixus]